MLSGQDKFKKPYYACLCKPEEKNGKSFAKGYIELSGKLWRVTISGSPTHEGCRWVNFSPARKNGNNYSNY